MKDIILEGVILFANLPPRSAQKGYESEDTSYSVLVECTEAKFKELKKDGIPTLTALKTFPDDFVRKDGTKVDCAVAEGKTFIRLKASKLKHCADGRVLEFKDPVVIDEEGNPIEVSIANGSTARVKATIEDIKGKAGKKVMRLKAVVVTNLIEYEGGNTLLKGLGVKLGNTKVITNNSDDNFLGA